MSKNRKVLILTTEGEHRESIRKSLVDGRFDPSFCGDIPKAKALMTEMSPVIFMHDWEALDKTQAAAFQQQLGRMDSIQHIIRVIYAKEVSPPLLALACDTNIRKILSYATVKLNLAMELGSALEVEKAAGGLLQEVRNLIASGSKYEQKKIDEKVEEAFAKFSQDQLVRVEYANLCFRQNKIKAAKDLGEDILKECPNNVRAMNLLSRVYMKQGATTRAISILEKANGLSPKSPERLCLLGDAFLNAGKVDKAKQAFGAAAELDPKNAKAKAGLGQVALSEGDMTTALDFFKNSSSEEEVAGFFNNAAIMAIKSNKFKEGISLYDNALKVLKSKTFKPKIMYNIALAYYRNGKYKEALSHAQKVLKVDPKFLKATKLITTINQQSKTNKAG